MILTLNNSSQLGRFLSRWYMPTNTCQLLWALVWIPLFMIFIGLIVSFAVVGVLLWVGVALQLISFSLTWTSVPTGPCMLFAVIVIGVALILTVMASLNHYFYNRNHSKSLGIFLTAYQGWKKKYCPLIRWI